MVVFVLLAAPSLAKKSACDSVKPEQQLETQRQQQIDTLVRAGVAGLGSAQVGVGTTTNTSYDTRLLAEDDLARSWYVYQLCVMKDDGVLSASLHDALMRELFGLQQQPQVPAPGAPAAEPSACPWGGVVDSVTIGDTAISLNNVGFAIATPEDQAKFRDALNQCRKGDAIVAFDKWLAARPQQVNVIGVNVGKFVDPPTPGAELLARNKLKKSLED